MDALNQYTAGAALSFEDREHVIGLCSTIAGQDFATVAQAIAYALEDETALEAISQIADFGL